MRLYIDGRMDSREQTNRIAVNKALTYMEKHGGIDMEALRKWILRQVTGLEIDGVTYIWPETFTYEESVRYYKEAREEYERENEQ